MAESPVSVNRISWRDIAPFTLIFRALPACMGMTVLTLALLAVAATPIGWFVAEKAFIRTEIESDQPLAREAERNRSPWKKVHPEWNIDRSLVSVLGHRLRGVELVFGSAIESAGGVFSARGGLWQFLYFLAGTIWTIAVWAFFGCAITRCALMRYTREEPVGLRQAFGFAIEKFFSCFGGIVIPLLAVFGLAIPIAIVGLLMATNLGVFLGGLVWVIALILALVMSVILLGLMFAWPLIVSAVSCEGQDSFDGMSRGFAYVFQRPVQYFCYALVAVIFSGVCWIVVSSVVEGTISTAYWASSWGMNVSDGDRSMDVFLGGPTTTTLNENGEAVDDGESSMLEIGQRMIRFWNGFARTLGAAFLYGLFWCIAASVYLLLRKDLDDTEMDEIFHVDERRTFELPPLKDADPTEPAEDSNANKNEESTAPEADPESRDDTAPADPE